ncbi:MAG: iron transporter FeoA [Fusobacteriia bacterium 4572_74]|nr:MAG: iron transporter FeoA [Fusobacteriia bacterium 4572_74]
MKLTELNRGERAIIVKIEKLGELKKRLTDMGITSGEVIKLERDAPLGDPQQFIIKGTGIAIRKEDANHIKIRDICRNKINLNRKK